MSSWTEFQQLRHILVGDCYEPNSFIHPDHELEDQVQSIFQKTKEDLQELAKIFHDEGVKVSRPKLKYQPDTNLKLLNDDTIKHLNQPMQPRDVMGVFGNKIIESFTHHNSRLIENFCYRDTVMDMFDSGSNIISMPIPDTFEDSHRGHGELYEQQKAIICDSANLIKCGKHILHSKAFTDKETMKKATSTTRGMEWFKRNLPEFEFIEVQHYGHIDGKISIIRPGLLVTWDKRFVPEQMSNWDIIVVDSQHRKGKLFPNYRPSYEVRQLLPEYFNELLETKYYSKLKQDFSHWIGSVKETVFTVNATSINEDTVVITGYDKDLYNQLESRGVKVINWDAKWRYFWDGGVHCCTVDLERDGDQENYL